MQGIVSCYANQSTYEKEETVRHWEKDPEYRVIRSPGQLGPYSGRGPRNYFLSDEQIREEVCERMTRHGQLDAHEIDVHVEDGVVTLTGRIRDRFGKRLAEDISDSVLGVWDVQNRLELQVRIATPPRWVDWVGQSGVYTVSEFEDAPRDSETRGMASWGQGERGARGYYDHGESELHLSRSEEEQPRR